MIELLPLIILLLSGVYALAFGARYIGRLGAVASLLTLGVVPYYGTSKLSFNWFDIAGLQVNFSFDFSQTGLLLCSVVLTILCCLHFAHYSCAIGRRFGLLNIFAFFMCFAILSDNIFQFYVGIEALGLISTALVCAENSKQHITQVETVSLFSFNKFASLTFLVAVFLLAAHTSSFDIATIQQFALIHPENIQVLLIPALLLLISCLCKGTQLPFSIWLINATKANLFASILIHAGTIVAIGTIFITKFYFLFDCFPVLKNAMVTVGAFTALCLALFAFAYDDLKKVIACLTASSSGIMFCICGGGEYSASLLYFSCHAFFKSVLFLGLAYFAVSRSENTSGAHCIALTAFFFAFGLPPSPSFFAKILLYGWLKIFASITGVLSAAAVLKFVSMSASISRFRDTTQKTEIQVWAFWLLIAISSLGSFAIWHVFQGGELHFGKDGIMAKNSVNYLRESLVSIFQIVLSLALAMLLKKININWGVSLSLLRAMRPRILNAVSHLVKNTDLMLQMFAKLLNVGAFRLIYRAGTFLEGRHSHLLSSHISWIFCGIVLLAVVSFLIGRE